MADVGVLAFLFKALAVLWASLALIGLAWAFLAARRAGRKGRGRAPRRASFWGRRPTWAELQAGRTVASRSGLMVRSPGERRVADLLDRLAIPYEYEPELHGWRPDFYVPRWDLVIEYWGTDVPGTPKRKAKVATFRRNGHKLIDLEKEDFPRLEEVLLRKLYRFDQDVYRRARASGLPAW